MTYCVAFLGAADKIVLFVDEIPASEDFVDTGEYRTSLRNLQ